MRALLVALALLVGCVDRPLAIPLVVAPREDGGVLRDLAVRAPSDLAIVITPDLAPPALPRVVWRQLFPLTNPGARIGHSMVYDTAQKRIVLFGGIDDALQVRDDTWSFDGTTWTLVPTVTRPSPRWGVMMAYDTIRQRTVQFGGRVESAAGIGGTWELAADGWVRQAIEDATYRWSAMGAFDPMRGRIVMFGGWLDGAPPDGTWEYDGTWLHHDDAGGPPEAQWSQLVYDSTAQRVRLLAHHFADPTKPEADLWSFDDGVWAKLDVSSLPPNPGGIFAHVAGAGLMAYGASGGEGRIWIHDETSGTAGTYAIDPAPRAIYYQGSAHDEATGCVVLFGGQDEAGVYYDETWELCAQ